jgi:uncharacterized membrane protein
VDVEPKKLIAALLAVFLLGITFAVLNGYYFSQAGSALPIIVYGISFLSIIIGAFIVLLFQWRINRAQLEKVLGILERDERVVIKILLDNKGHIEQNYIVALSGMHKVAVSRTIAKLEARGVVEKKPLGNTNMIILKL